MVDILQKLGDFETKIEAARGLCEHRPGGENSSEGWLKPLFERPKLGSGVLSSNRPGFDEHWKASFGPAVLCKPSWRMPRHEMSQRGSCRPLKLVGSGLPSSHSRHLRFVMWASSHVAVDFRKWDVAAVTEQASQPDEHDASDPEPS